MSKYIGDFNKLKDYEFTKLTGESVYQWSKYNNTVFINVKTRQIYSVTYSRFDCGKVNNNPIRFKVVKQLIKDGLIIKEDCKCLKVE